MSEKADKRKKQISSVGNVADLALPQIIRTAMEKDPAAMAELFERTRRHLYYYAYMLTGNTADAEDLLQEAYIKCILSLDTLQNPDAFYTWMWTILRNLRANNIRRQKYMVMSSDALAEEENRVLEALIDDTDTPEKQTEKKELAGILRHMIHALPAEQQEVVLLHYYDELTLSDIAKIQDCPLATVKSRLLYAKKSLRTAIRMEEEKCGVALHSTVLIPLYPAILARLSNLISLSADSAFSIFMNVAAFFGVTCSGDTIQLLGTTTTDDHPIRDKAYVIRVRVAPIVAAGMALCVAIGFGAGKAFTRTDAVPVETVTVEDNTSSHIEETASTSFTTTEIEKEPHIVKGDFSTQYQYSVYTYISSLGMKEYKLQVGDMLAMQYYPHPYTCTDQTMDLVSMDESILRCEGKQIIGVSPGSTRVYFVDRNTLASVPWGNSMQITVTPAVEQTERINSVTFMKDQLCNLLPGYVNSLNYTTNPTYCKAEELWFLSDDPAVATYDGTSLYAWEAGNTTIRCIRAEDGAELGSIPITVYADANDFPQVLPNNVVLYPEAQIIFTGDTCRLIYDIQPVTARDDSWKIVIDNPDVISYDGYRIKGLSAGKAQLQFVRKSSGEILGSINYVVLPPKEE